MEEWVWPIVEELAKSLLFQEDELGEDEEKMIKYITNNILEDNNDVASVIHYSSRRSSFHHHQESWRAPGSQTSVSFQKTSSAFSTSSVNWSYVVFTPTQEILNQTKTQFQFNISDVRFATFRSNNFSDSFSTSESLRSSIPESLQENPQENLHSPPGQMQPVSLPKNSLFRDFNVEKLEQEVINRRGRHRRTHCGFCKKNGEPPAIYTNHTLHDRPGGKVTCPYLRGLVCEQCGATGDDAHTKTYCPEIRGNIQQPLPILLRNTKHQSDGSVRRKNGR